MQKDREDLNIGVLDIYGFEIFQVNLVVFSKCISFSFIFTRINLKCLFLSRKMDLNNFALTL